MENNKLGQEPAFPTSAQLDGESIYQAGMSKRFYAACCAMQGLISHYGLSYSENHSVEAFKLADNLLEQENAE